MSGSAMLAIRGVTDVSGADKCVLYALADHADDGGRCFLSVATLARETCFTERTVRRSLRTLEAASKIKTEVVRGVGYRFLVPVTTTQAPEPVSITPDTLSKIATFADTLSALPPGGRADTQSKTPDTQSKNSDTTTPAPEPVAPKAFKELVVEDQTQTYRATRIPPDFIVTPAMIRWAETECPKIVKAKIGNRVTSEFVDYYRAATGDRAIRADWVAVWRAWMRRHEDKMPNDGRRSPDEVTYGAPRLGSPEDLAEKAMQAQLEAEFQARLRDRSVNA